MTAARRLLSFTRSSARPCMTVRPRANAAATARIGYSSIIEGARSAGTSTPVRVDALTVDVGDRLAALDRARLVEAEDPRPFRSSVVEQAGAQRVHHHVADGQLRSGYDQRRDDREGGGRRIARNDNARCRSRRAPRAEADHSAVAFHVAAECAEHIFAVVAARRRLDHLDLARCAQPGEQDRRLHLRRRLLVDEADAREGCRHGSSPAAYCLRFARPSRAAARARVPSGGRSATRRR